MEHGRVPKYGLAAEELHVGFHGADAGGLGRSQSAEVVAGSVSDEGGRHRSSR